VRLDGGSSSDPDGTIVSWNWKRISGPTAYSIVAANSPVTIVTGLTRGLYEFQLTVFDNRGASSTSRIKVNVIKINKKPVVITPDTIRTSLPATNVALSGTDSYDPDGIIVSQNWTFRKGPKPARLISADSVKAIASDLVEGIYEFEFSVKDDDDETTSKITIVEVSKSKDKDLNLKVGIYPNPVIAETSLTLDSELNGRTYITVYSTNGTLVYQEIFLKDFAKVVKRLNLSQLASGIYFVNIRLLQSEAVTLKIMKQ
jgi:hypothetical protein